VACSWVNFTTITTTTTTTTTGARGGVVVKALRYKPAGSIPDGVNGIFQWHNPSGRTMTLGSTKPLTEIENQVYFPGVKAAGA